MVKIREDLSGVVSVGGLNLRAGDVVPDGVSVGDHVLAPVEPVAEDKPKPAPKRARRKATDSEEE